MGNIAILDGDVMAASVGGNELSLYILVTEL
jgi:hypothetical protein